LVAVGCSGGRAVLTVAVGVVATGAAGVGGCGAGCGAGSCGRVRVGATDVTDATGITGATAGTGVGAERRNEVSAERRKTGGRGIARGFGVACAGCTKTGG
jgi:hypothetical protein